MNHYQQSLVVDATPATVYAALTTPEGLRGWWTADCDVHTAVGETITVRFGQTHKDMRVDRLDAGREVRWHVTQAHIAAGNLTRRDEWAGTDIVFRLSPAGSGRTRLDFEHVGLVPSLDCYALCDNGWRYFLASLKQLAEAGRGTPYVADSTAAQCAPCVAEPAEAQ
jgi:uncharacterized protein YndB with AHSA1/START domain